MAVERFRVDPEALQAVANSLMSIKRSVENVVDTLPAIKRMSAEAWPNDDSVADIFEENCQKLRVRCIELMQSMDRRSKNLSEAVAKYRDGNAGASGIARRLSGENIFT